MKLSKTVVSLFVTPILFSSLLLSTAAMAASPVPPGIDSVTITGTVQVGQTLTAVAHGVTGDSLNPIGYAWRVRDDSCGWQNGVEYDVGFDSTYTVDSGLEGWDLYVIAVVSTGSNDGEFPDYVEAPIVGTASQLINTIAPTIGSATISGTAKVGETLTATANSVTPSTYWAPTASYQWKAGGSNVGTNSNTYTPLLGDVGKAITVVITESDGFVPTQLATCVFQTQPSASATSDPTSNVLAAGVAPTIGSATISGIAKVGETLTATANTVTGSPTPTASYQWKAGGSNVGTNSNTYTPLVGDVGKAITVVITESNGISPNASATSDPTSNVFLAIDQAKLKISNESEDLKASSTIRLTTRGGSGEGLVTYAISGGTAGVSGANCVISGSNLSTTQSGSCIVIATKAANGIYKAATSSAVTFTFKAIAQASLTLIPGTRTGNAGTPITLGVSGGSGAGLYSFASTTAGCTVATIDPVAGTGTITRSASSGSCSVKVTKAANGIYSAATSPSVSVTFLR